MDERRELYVLKFHMVCSASPKLVCISWGNKSVLKWSLATGHSPPSPFIAAAHAAVVDDDAHSTSDAA